MIRLALFVALATAIVAYVYWVYLRVELPVAGNRWLAATRAVVLVVILALLFDPRLPTRDGSESAGRWAALDVSLSMTAGVDPPWRRALERAEELRRDGWRVVTFGGRELGGDAEPVGVSSRLLPVIERAAVAGVGRVRVLSDGRFEDAVAVRAALDELPLDVLFELWADSVRNVGVASLSVPDAPRAGGAVPATVDIHALGIDSARLEIAAEGRLLASEMVALPSSGLRRAVSLDVVPPESDERVRYTARLVAEGDGFPTDDEAVAYASVGHEEGGLVLISAAPDWEPRYLLPVLAEVTGLEGRGYLRAGADRYVEIGRALDRTGPTDSAAVGRAARDAALTVLHGLSGNLDPWLARLARGGGRLVLMPNDAAGASLAGVETSPPRAGEWYVSGEVPPSPLSAELAGVAWLGLPPLSGLLAPAGAVDVVSPLGVQLRGTGVSEPALHLAEGASGRRVVTLASGFWRWAMREGEGEEAYRRLWSGVAGWLLSDEEAAGPEPRPRAWVFSRGEDVSFSLPGSGPYRLSVLRSDSLVSDTTATEDLALGVLPPGSYAYRFESDEGAAGGGRFDVAHTTDELALPAAGFDAVSAGGPTGAATSGGRPLRTSYIPYLLIIVLLCLEWVVRRRSGLR